MTRIEDPDHGDCLAAVRFWCAAIMHYQEMINRGLLPESLDDLPLYEQPYKTEEEALRKDTGVVPERIYVSGPISADTDEKVADNYAMGQEIGETLGEMGHMVFVPHNYVLLYQGSHTLPPGMYEQLLQFDLSIIEKWATALYFIGPSPGANRERARAEELGLKIYHSLDQVPDLSSRDNTGCGNLPWM
jgi:hypothetical protein